MSNLSVIPTGSQYKSQGHIPRRLLEHRGFETGFVPLSRIVVVASSMKHGLELCGRVVFGFAAFFAGEKTRAEMSEWRQARVLGVNLQLAD